MWDDQMIIRMYSKCFENIIASSIPLNANLLCFVIINDD